MPKREPMYWPETMRVVVSLLPLTYWLLRTEKPVSMTP